MTPKQLAALFKALSNPHRVQIFMDLLGCTPEQAKNVQTIASSCRCALSTVSHHLKELRNADLVRCERRGQSVECWLHPDAVAVLKRFVADLER